MLYTRSRSRFVISLQLTQKRLVLPPFDGKLKKRPIAQVIFWQRAANFTGFFGTAASNWINVSQR